MNVLQAGKENLMAEESKETDGMMWDWMVGRMEGRDGGLYRRSTVDGGRRRHHQLGATTVKNRKIMAAVR